MKKSASIVEVKATLSRFINEVENGGFLLITRHGKVVAALVPPDNIEHLQRLRKAGPEGGLASLAGGWAGSDELLAILDASSRVGQRDVSSLY